MFVVPCDKLGLGSGRFTHPTEQRGITMREAARLQSFDDDFRLVTSETDDSDTTRLGIGMDMIGEAVPPLLSQAIATHLAAQLDARDASAPRGRKEQEAPAKPAKQKTATQSSPHNKEN